MSNTSQLPKHITAGRTFLFLCERAEMDEEDVQQRMRWWIQRQIVEEDVSGSGSSLYRIVENQHERDEARADGASVDANEVRCMDTIWIMRFKSHCIIPQEHFTMRGQAQTQQAYATYEKYVKGQHELSIHHNIRFYLYFELCVRCQVCCRTSNA